MDNLEEIRSYAKKLKNKMWATRGARFEAYRYYLQKHTLSSYSISIFSSYLIALGLLSTFKIFSNIVLPDNIIQFLSIALSVLILAISQIESSNDYKLKGERFHDCSKEIAFLITEIDYLLLNIGNQEITNLQAIKNVSDKYELIIQKHSDNHKPIHYKVFKSQHPVDFPMSWSEKVYIRFLIFFEPRWFYLILIIGPPLFLLWRVLS